MSGPLPSLTAALRVTAVACALLATGLHPDRAWSQAMQQQPAPQKSFIIQVAPLVPPVAQPAPPPPAPEPPAPVAEAPSENPGLINELGKLFKS
ncbi:MAG: hypothetical protein ABW151_12225, partial [Pseudorhodoplanes sp.]